MRSVSRTVRHRIALATLASICCGGELAEARQESHRKAASVCIDLTFIDTLSGPTFKVMRSEASRIWLSHGIMLRWTQPAPGECDTVVPLVFDETRLRRALGRKASEAMAVTVFLGRSRIVYVSAPRAFAMLARLHEVDAGIVSGGARELRGGVLLGRVVAHELGHVLLNTTAHADAGLMRPVFGKKDALSSAAATTELSPEDETYLATRFSLSSGCWSADPQRDLIGLQEREARGAVQRPDGDCQHDDPHHPEVERPQLNPDDRPHDQSCTEQHDAQAVTPG